MKFIPQHRNFKNVFVVVFSDFKSLILKLNAFTLPWFKTIRFSTR